MHFPVYIHIGPWTLPPHPIFESLAYFVGARVYFAIRRRNKHRSGPQLMPSTDESLWITVGAVLGAAIGAKLLSLLENPAVLIHHLNNPQYWTGGQTIVGALLGGLIGVEFAKKRVGWRLSTGDDFVLPLIVGMCIGRVGCFLAGLPDHTYGTPTHLFTGIDFGDGIKRHPTQLYEIGFLLIWGVVIYRLTPKGPQAPSALPSAPPVLASAVSSGFITAAQTFTTSSGSASTAAAQATTPHLRRQQTPAGVRFQLFMFGYLLFRLLVEFIKPTPHVYFGFSNIQLASIAGMLYYAPKLWNWMKSTSRPMEATHHA